MKEERTFYVLKFPNGKYVGPRQIEEDGDNMWRQARYDKGTFMSAQSYKTKRNAKLAHRHFPETSIREIRVTYEEVE